MLSSRGDFAPVTRHFFAPSLCILYAADFNYLIRWVIVTYILLDISVVNWHTNANCSPLHGTIYRAYDLTMRISDSAVKTAPTAAYAVQLVYNVNRIFTRSKLIALFVLAILKQ